MCSHELSCLKFDKGVNRGSPDEDFGGGGNVEDNENSSTSESEESSLENGQSAGRLGSTLYITNTIRRPLLPCASEVKMTEHLAGLIECLQPNSCLYMHESNLATCKSCGQLNTSKPNWLLRRNVRLFTLSQGTVPCVVSDWYCEYCEEKNLFSGKYHGIFPARKESCYTTEVMYSWSQMVCLHGFSFREAYRNTRLTSYSISNISRFRRKGSENYNPDQQPSRNRANEAFREFSKTIKTDCPKFTRLAFSCSRCEVPLTPDDCAKLKIDHTLADDLQLKRFKAIVIDGTAAGVLAKLPKYTRSFSLLKSVRLIHHKIVQTAPHQKALQFLLRICTEGIRTHRKRKSLLFHFSPVSNLQFWLCNPLDSNRDIIVTKTEMKLSQAQVVMLMYHDNACFCGAGEDENAEHSEYCESLHSDFKRPNPLVTDVLNSIFKVSCGAPLIQGQIGSGHIAQDLHQAAAEEVLDLVIGATTEQDANQEHSEDNNGGANGSSDDAGQGSLPRTSYKSISATIFVPDVDKHADFLEALVSFLHFTTLEHVAMPYVTRMSHNTLDIDLVSVPPVHNVPRNLVAMTSSSIKLHEKVVQSIRQYCYCDRHGEESDEVPWQDCSCVDEIKKWAPLLQDGNPLLETLCIQLKRLRRPSQGSVDSQIMEILKKLCNLMETHLAMTVNYLHRLQRKMSKEAKTYWQNCDYRQIVTEDAEVDDEFKWYETGMCFPGRSCCRPGIKFEVKETQHCNKKYPKSETHSPGLLTVQCACESPKLIGLIIMTRAESTSIVLSAILMYFPVPPRTVYYDNACNLFASIFLRLPWLLNCTRVAVYRFHYKLHICSPFFCPDSYQVLDHERTETAESFNARIEKSLYHMRYLGSDNLIPFLYNRLGQLNISSLFKEKFNRQDLEDEDLPAFLRSTYKCTCNICLCHTAQIGESENITTTQQRENDAQETNGAQEEGNAKEDSRTQRGGDAKDDNGSQESEAENTTERNAFSDGEDPLTPFTPSETEQP